MPEWTVEVLDDDVVAEIDAWPRELRAALTRIIERITSLGLDRVGEPHVRHIEGKLWEMRPSGKRMEGRALYVTAVGRRIVIVLAFVKKTRKTPDHVIKLALDRARSIR
jgi:phage-related protein